MTIAKILQESGIVMSMMFRLNLNGEYILYNNAAWTTPLKVGDVIEINNNKYVYNGNDAFGKD